VETVCGGGSLMNRPVVPNWRQILVSMAAVARKKRVTEVTRLDLFQAIGRVDQVDRPTTV
jgi:hypothetical protein